MKGKLAVPQRTGMAMGQKVTPGNAGGNPFKMGKSSDGASIASASSKQMPTTMPSSSQHAKPRGAK